MARSRKNLINMYPKAEDTPLPPDVKKEDTRYPTEGIGHDERKALGLGYESLWPGYLKFHLCLNLSKGTQWVIATLSISGGKPPRTYAVGVADSKVYTVGNGPHVKATVQVYLSKANIDRLRKYVELWKKGMADAGMIRDRISSRRAQGKIHRANGESSWYW